MKSISLVIISFLCLFNLSAQNKPSKLNDLEDNYTNYFKLNRETVFLHLNKTSVIKKENLWLSAYVYDATLNLPNRETVNLNLDIYNETGKFLESKTVLIAEGKGSAFLDLNKDIYPAGKYFIKASTRYMENFREELSFVQSFEILGGLNEETSENKSKYDLQLLPEGGHMLAEVRNNIGVKLIDSHGSSVIFEDGKLHDSKGNTIITFKSNQFGLAKFNFLPTAQENYNIEVTTKNGEKLNQILPQAALRGFNILGNNLSDQIIFKINTNTSSKDMVQGKTFYAAIHQDGNIKDFAFQFPQNKLEVSMSFSKDSIYSGINTVTIFDENFNPLVERLFFNKNDLKRIRVNANANMHSDSIKINLKSAKSINNNSLSISVLPAATKSYNPKHNILSAFYLKPYISGDLENGNYYFSNSNPRKIDYDLDLLMLTQGWSKFNWSYINNSTPTELVEQERGFTVAGNINGRNKKKENTIFIRSEETGLFEILEVNNDDTFLLENVYVLDSSALSYGLMNDRNNKISKPSIYATIFPNKSHTELETKFKSNKSEIENRKDYHFENFIQTANNLDTIILIGENKKTNKYLNDLKVIKPDVTITDEIASRYLFITDYIAANGFKVITGGYGNLVIENKKPSSISSGSTPIPQIYFNGIRLGTDTSPLVYLKTSEVESIIISKSGIGYGMRGNNGVIEITTRKGGGNSTSSKETIKEIITNNGFSLNKEFYAPKYASYTNDLFKEYGVIDWVSDLSFKQNGTASFKVLNTIQPEILLYIEGLTVDGYLISEEINIPTR